MRNNDFPAHMVLAQAVARSDADAAQKAATQAVARLLGTSPDAVGIVRGAAGPSVTLRRAGLHCPEPVALSYAHSGRRSVAVAASASWRVGIDLEPRGAVHGAMRRMFLSARERRALARIDATSAWCMKEAAWKMLGCPSDMPFHALEVCPSGNCRLNGELVHASFALLRPWNGWVAALVWMHADARTRFASRVA